MYYDFQHYSKNIEIKRTEWEFMKMDAIKFPCNDSYGIIVPMLISTIDFMRFTFYWTCSNLTNAIHSIYIYMFWVPNLAMTCCTLNIRERKKEKTNSTQIKRTNKTIRIHSWHFSRWFGIKSLGSFSDTSVPLALLVPLTSLQSIKFNTTSPFPFDCMRIANKTVSFRFFFYYFCL